MVDSKKRSHQQYKLSNTVIKKIDLLRFELPKRGVEQIKTDFFHLIRNFFKEFLGVSYEFTASELKLDIQKDRTLSNEQKETLIKMVFDFEDKKFSPIELTEDEIGQIMNDFRKVILGMIEHSFDNQIENKKGFDSLLFKFYQEMNKFLLKLHGKDEAEFFKQYYVAREHLLKGEVGLARETSKKMLLLFAKIPAEKKKEYFKVIGDLNKKIADKELDDILFEIDSKFDKIHHFVEKEDLKLAKEEYKELTRLYDLTPKAKMKQLYHDMDKCFKIIKEKESELTVRVIEELIKEARRALIDKNRELVDELYTEIDDKFLTLNKKDQKKLKKYVDELYFDIYAEAR